VGQPGSMKPSRLITMVAFSALAACLADSDSQFRDDEDPMCDADEGPIDISSTTIELWPPNHKMTTIDLAECAEIVSCDPDWTAEILWVSSDEPADAAQDDDCDEDDDDGDDDEDDDDGDEDGDEDGTSSSSTGDAESGTDDGSTGTTDDGGTGTTDDGGTGTTDDGGTGITDDGGTDDDDEDDDGDDDDDATSSEDIVLVGPDEVQLRAERDGSGNGRVYTIAFIVRDAGGNEAESTCTVTVPHDQGKNGEAIDDGEAYRVEP
jgi:hypothetical protein